MKDPQKLHDAAATLGRSVAEGGATLPAARMVCSTMAENARDQGYTGDRGGLQARLCWTMADTASAHASAVWQAEDDLHRAVRQLIAIRAPKAEVEEAAGPFSEMLGWPRIYAILQDEVRRAKFLARWR